MFREERTDKILEYVRKKNFCTVDELVKWFNYSPATIRRDLTYLASLDLVKKSYGGVSSTAAKPMQVREHVNVRAKVKLCERAAELIRDGDVVFVDGTTTTYFLGEKLLGKKNVTVVTTNLKLAMFCGEHRIKCIVAGGNVVDTSMLCGPFCIETVEKIKYDVAVISPGVMDFQGRVSVWSGYWEADRIALRNSAKRVLICDHNKIRDDEKYVYCDLSAFDVVILDEKCPESISKAYPDVEYLVAD